MEKSFKKFGKPPKKRKKIKTLAPSPRPLEYMCFCLLYFLDIFGVLFPKVFRTIVHACDVSCHCHVCAAVFARIDRRVWLRQSHHFSSSIVCASQAPLLHMLHLVHFSLWALPFFVGIALLGWISTRARAMTNGNTTLEYLGS